MTRDEVCKKVLKNGESLIGQHFGRHCFSEIMMPNRNILKHGSEVLYRQKNRKKKKQKVRNKIKRSFCVLGIKGVPGQHRTNPRIYADSKPGLSNKTSVLVCAGRGYARMVVMVECSCL